MNELLKNIFNKINIPSFYAIRPEECTYCIIYFFNEFTGAISDLKEERTKFDIYINFITDKENINKDINIIKKALEDNNFYKVKINAPIKFEDLDFFQITMNYEKSINNY
ncbi:MAG: hypothetical protein ACRCUM_02590 [Mycoplasmoidaceae bacterium]